MTRFRRANTAACGAALLLLPSTAMAQASFQGLGDLPGGDFGSIANAVSADGSVVVGEGTNADDHEEPFRWTAAGGMVGLGSMEPDASGVALGVSGDGAVVVGLSSGAFRWTAGGGMQGLGSMPGGGSAERAYAASDDGSVIVGFGRNAADDIEAFRWTAGGIVSLGDLPGGAVDSRAYAVSDDGSVIVGEGVNSTGHEEAFRWTSGGGIQGLGRLPGAPSSGGSYAFAVSADGSVVVGQSNGPNGNEAYRWTASTGMVGLGDFPGGSFFSRAHGVSADGSVIVGFGTGPEGTPEVFLWTAAGGMRSLRDVLANDHGIVLTGWDLDAYSGTVGISADGTTIVGGGRNPQGDIEAWRAILPRCAATVAWTQPTSGAFGDPTRWTGGAVPTEDQAALFNAGTGTESYTVTLGEARTTAVLEAARGAVTLALGGATYSLAGTPGVVDCTTLRVVDDPAAGVALNVEGGRLAVTGDGAVEGAQNELRLFDAELLVTGAVTVTAEADSAAAPRLRVGNLALLTAEGVLIGIGDGEAGVLDVRGGGQADVAGGLAVGFGVGSAGYVRVMGEGELRAGEMTLGFLAGSTGFLRVEGAFGPGRLTAVSRLDVGFLGTGTLTVNEGALLDGGADTVLGFEPGGEGLLTVHASSATFRYLEVGLRGRGTLIANGGTAATAGRVTVGAFAGGVGDLLVVGAGTFLAAERVALGLGGAGSLAVNSGASAAVGELVVGPGGFVDTDGGTLVVGGGAGAGALSPLRGAGLTADTLLVAPGATLDVGGVELAAGGVLGGAGTLSFDLTNAGTINPGDSAGVAGTFTIGGAYMQAAGGILEIELGGTAGGAYDQLAVSGAATLDGTLRFSHIGGFTPAPGDIFDVLTAGSSTGAFAGVDGPPGCTYSLAYGPTSVTATVLTVAAEPPAGAAGLVLHAPAPNPALGPTTIRYELPAAGAVRLAVYDALGRVVAVLLDEQRPAGAGAVTLDAGRLAPGAYLARLETSTGAAHRSIVVIR